MIRVVEVNRMLGHVEGIWVVGLVDVTRVIEVIRVVEVIKGGGGWFEE